MKEIIVVVLLVTAVIVGLVEVVPAVVVQSEVSAINTQEQKDLEEVKRRVDRMKHINGTANIRR